MVPDSAFVPILHTRDDVPVGLAACGWLVLPAESAMTRIFISWSGEPSLTVAHFLRDWMGNVINAATPWMSGEDIAAGALWSQEVSEALSATDIGVLCVTSRNQRSPWLNFEAGALAKALQQSRVIPYLIGLSAGELEGPLKQFQAVTADKSGSWRLCQSVNEGLGRPLNDKKLELSFGKWWPDLAQVLTDLPEVSEEPALVPGTDQTWPKRKPWTAWRNVFGFFRSLNGAWSKLFSRPRIFYMTRLRQLGIQTGGYTWVR